MVKGFPLNQTEYSYNAQEVSYYYAGRHSGVFALGTNCEVSFVEGMNIKVSKGKGWLAHGVEYGIVFWMEEDISLTVPAGDSVSPRWDFVCVGWNTNEVKENPTIYIKSGTPATTPVEPTLENSSNKIEICLAKIYVPAGTSNLFDSGVSFADTRADNDYCGLVGDDLRADNLEKRTDVLEETTSDLGTRTTKLENGTTPAGNATKLATARTINGTSFDGSQNIVTDKWGADRNFYIDTVKAVVNGSSDVSLNTLDIKKVTIADDSEYVIVGCDKVGQKKLYVLTFLGDAITFKITNFKTAGQLVFFTNAQAPFTSTGNVQMRYLPNNGTSGNYTISSINPSNGKVAVFFIIGV